MRAQQISEREKSDPLNQQVRRGSVTKPGLKM